RKIAFKIIHSTTGLLPKWRDHVAGTQFKGLVLPRDVSTRWNSTYDMLAAFLAMREPVTEFLDRSRHGLSDFALDDDEWNTIEGLVSVLKEATMFFSTGAPSVAAIIPAMDILDEVFASGIVNTAILSGPVRHALSIGKRTLNKYYALTDDSYLYRMAIGEQFFRSTTYSNAHHLLVLHPSLKLDYLRNAKWPDSWVDTAAALTRENWERTYKPSQPASPAADAVKNL
ncbi:hypothetical protein EV361DRAFT_813512, partial [Lentinula raphanica]